MRIQEFENCNLKKDQRVKIYYHHNGYQMLFCSGKISNIKKRKYKRYQEKYNESGYYNLQIILDNYDYLNDCDMAEIGSYIITDVEIIN